MFNLSTLTEAINNKKVISYEYDKKGKDNVVGKRIGQPFAVFDFISKSGERTTKVHIVQTGGVSNSKTESKLPSFRTYNLDDLRNIKVTNEFFLPPYHEDYNPNWDGYKKAKVKLKVEDPTKEIKNGFNKRH